LAVTRIASLTVTVQVEVPLQPPPLQPVNSESAAGVAVKVTEVPGVYCSEQSTPQLIPVGAEATVPLPLPVLVTSSEPLRAKVALIVVAAVIVATH
jgi:hypothetical protein